MHDPRIRQRATTLLRNGSRNVDVARLLGVPAGTVSHWKHLDLARRGALPGRKPSTCPHCHGDPLDAPAYSHLLGLYLGDGYLVLPRQHRAHSLQVTCDDRWPGLMDEVERTFRRVLPNNKPCRVRRTGCHDIKVYSKHLPCLFPQHGPGKKHERPIVLERWQQDVVDAHSWELLWGLLHSDGCRITNWATRTVGGVTRRHVPAVLLHQHLGRHRPALHHHPGRRGRRLDRRPAAHRGGQRLGRPAGVGGVAGRARRAQAVTARPSPTEGRAAGRRGVS